MINKNSYNTELFKVQFKQTELYRKLIDEYDEVSFDYFFEQHYITSSPRLLLATKVCSAVPFYYLSFIDTTKPTYDLGCGANIFKKYYPNIIGVSPELGDRFFGDEHGAVDDNYVKVHTDYFESVFSINALHFVPLSNFRKVVDDFASMIKPGGSGFLSLNALRMCECDTEFKNNTPAETEDWIRTQLNLMPYNFQVLDVNLEVPNAWIDGNIRMVIRK